MAEQSQESHQRPGGGDRTRESRGLLANLRIVSLCTLLSRVFGLCRDIAMASLFGAGSVMDAFSLAFRVPNAARKLFGDLPASQPISFILRAPEVGEAISRALSTGTAATVTFYERVPADRWFEARVSPLGDVAGLPRKAPVFLVLLRDLTEAQRVERMRVDFVANASHELRTPLASVTGFIETLQGPARNDPDARDRFLDIMAVESERMSRLISDLLSLSRIESSEQVAPRDQVDMQDVMRSGAAALEGLADERNVRLHVSRIDTPLPVIGNRDELIQVVENLISNAIKYCRKDGTVRVTYGFAADTLEARAKAGQAWENSERMTLLQSVNRPGPGEPAVWVRVEDEGPGIERQHLPRLGERFYRTDQSRGGKITGTGLGLAIVKHIMAHHRGGMAVETVMEKGSAFGVWLPAMRPKPDPE